MPPLALAALALALGPNDAPRYYPATAGAKWTYRYPEAEIGFVVTKVTQRGDESVVSVGRVRDAGAVTPHLKVGVSDRGVYQLESVVVRAELSGDPAAKPTPLPDGWMVHELPVCLLDARAKPGSTEEDKSQTPVTRKRTTLAPERVTVPAGTFTAAVVEVETVLGVNHSLRHRYWYAPGMGAVKWTFDSGTEKGEIVMTSFTPGEK